MYCIELSIKLNPIPFVLQRKKFEDAQKLYAAIIESMKKSNERFIELTCEKVEDKKITLLVNEIIAVQIYEKTSSSGGSKRPGFSFEN